MPVQYAAILRLCGFTSHADMITSPCSKYNGYQSGRGDNPRAGNSVLNIQPFTSVGEERANLSAVVYL